MLSKARKRYETSGIRPVWISEEIWAQMLVKWADPRQVEKREKNRANRAASDAHYCGGSIPTSVHLERMRAAGKDADALSLFEATHTGQDGNLIDARAVAIRDAYTERLSQYQTQSQDDGSGSSSQPHPDTFQVWGEVAGSKKGRVYGLGSEASSATPLGSRARTETQTPEEMELIRQELQQAREREEQAREEARQREEQAREREERLLTQFEEMQRQHEASRLQIEEMRREQEASRAMYARLESLLATRGSTDTPPSDPSPRGAPLQLSHDDILPPTQIRPPASSSGPSSSRQATGSSRGSRGSRGSSRGRHL